jgi:hypothetical protein
MNIYKGGQAIALLREVLCYSQMIAGSILDEAIGFFNVLNPSSSTMALVLT